MAVRRPVLPSSKILVALSLGPAIVAAERDDGRALRAHPSGLVAGFDDAVGVCEHAGFETGIRLDLTPLGARRLFGAPASELAGRIVELADVLPRTCAGLVDRLRELPDWHARFDALQELLARVIRPTEPERDPMAWAVSRIDASRGQVQMQALVAQLGYSHKHVLRMFERHVGTTPKRYARLVRFEEAVRAIRTRSSTGFAALAEHVGYSDQAHLVREFQRFTGMTPVMLAKRLQS